MIFVTVGSLYPFDRLIKAADTVAAANPHLEFFAQIGDSDFEPRHMKFAKLVDRAEFKSLAGRSKLFVAHAGMGSIITAMELGTPIIIVPRRYDMGEHNTDHQAATARSLGDRAGVFTCDDPEDLGRVIGQVLAEGSDGNPMSTAAPTSFTARIRDWILA